MSTLATDEATLATDEATLAEFRRKLKLANTTIDKYYSNEKNKEIKKIQEKCRTQWNEGETRRLGCQALAYELRITRREKLPRCNNCKAENKSGNDICVDGGRWA